MEKSYEQAIDIALSHVLWFCDGTSLCAVLHVNKSWRRTFCCLNGAHQSLFQGACLQRWPWLQSSLVWPCCGHHLWQHYLGSWKALCCDANRANAVCTLELVVPLGGADAPCVRGPWVPVPGRNLLLRINAYPIGNSRMTTSHLSAYLEVQGLAKQAESHVSLDFTFVLRHPLHPTREVSWSSGPVRFLELPSGSGRTDWGCHELIPIEGVPLDNVRGQRSEVILRAHVALQEALVDVVHADALAGHADDFGLCSFSTFDRRRAGAGAAEATEAPAREQPVRLVLPASATKAELLGAASRALLRPVTRLWRFSRSASSPGRLACGLPEAPRHLMASIHSEDDDRSTVYALLTKWTQGESAGGQRQNFFRLLAEDACPGAEEADADGVGGGEATQVFVKLHEPGRGLRVEAFVTVPAVEDPRGILPAVLAAVGRRRDLPTGEPWCLVYEGSPCDWATWAPPADLEAGLVNGRGPLVRGDVLVLCLRRHLPDVAALYRGRYEERVASFVSLWRREDSEPGSVEFAALCRVMDRLNVDAWRLEQLAAAASGTSKPLLGLMQRLPGLHPQFFCDGCGTRELRGSRFNCLECSDFDLCEGCHELGPRAGRAVDHSGRPHERHHRMVELRPPLPADCRLEQHPKVP